jgi:hypothetical protein
MSNRYAACVARYSFGLVVLLPGHGSHFGSSKAKFFLSPASFSPILPEPDEIGLSR